MPEKDLSGRRPYLEKVQEFQIFLPASRLYVCKRAKKIFLMHVNLSRKYIFANAKDCFTARPQCRTGLVPLQPIRAHCDTGFQDATCPKPSVPKPKVSICQKTATAGSSSKKNTSTELLQMQQRYCTARRKSCKLRKEA